MLQATLPMRLKMLQKMQARNNFVVRLVQKRRSRIQEHFCSQSILGGTFTGALES
jgi:hypothetical protein